jgi:hypothetical protein
MGEDSFLAASGVCHGNDLVVILVILVEEYAALQGLLVFVNVMRIIWCLY